MKKPSYLITFIILIVGIIVVGMVSYFDFSDKTYTNKKIDIGTEKTVYLKKGKYTLFLNEPSVNRVGYFNELATIETENQVIHFRISIVDKNNNQYSIMKVPSETKLIYDNQVGVLQVIFTEDGEYSFNTEKASSYDFSNQLLISDYYTVSSEIIVDIIKNVVIGLVFLSGAFVSYIVIHKKRKWFS